MINEECVRKYCCEDISKIENYEQAINDNTQVWDCHHKLEIQGEFTNSVELLKVCGLYYQVPAWQLIFLTHGEHRSLHNHYNTGEKNPNFGKHWSEDIKRKLSEANKGENNPTSKSVSQYTKSSEFIKSFVSTCEAERETGICQSSISKCCRGKRKSAGGFIWKF